MASLPVEHGNEAALGFRFGNAAHARREPDPGRDPLARLHGLDLLIIDGPADTLHPTHFSVLTRWP